MSKEHYNRIFSSVIENSLLHLYGAVASNGRFVTLSKRNNILCQYLKPKIKEPRYKIIKSDIKRLVLTGQKNNANLEAKLNEIYTLSIEKVSKQDDAKSLYDLLNMLLQDLGLDSKIWDKSKADLNVIYISQEHLENCFNDKGKQVSPVLLLIKHEDATSLVEKINETLLFNAELEDYCTVSLQARIILHPICS